MHEPPGNPAAEARLADLLGTSPGELVTESLAIEAGAPTARRRITFGAWLAIGWLALVSGLALLAPVLPIPSPTETVTSPFHAPTGGHLLGADTNGRDVLSREIWGARQSLTVGFGAVLAGFLVGGFLGLVSGFFRNRVAAILPAFLDMMLAFPQLILALAIVAFLGQKTQNLVLALAIVATPIVARIARANTLAWSPRDFVLAARAQGAKPWRILWREVFPNVLPAMVAIALLGVGIAIVAEGSLSILSLGVKLPTPSWGNILAEARNDLSSGDATRLLLTDCLVIFLTVLSLNHLGDVIRARFDVRESAL